MAKSLKFTLALSITVILFTCKAKKNSTDTPVREGYVSAVLVEKMGDGGCDFVLVVKNLSEEITYVPANLDDKMKKDGLPVHVKFKVSRMPAPNGCTAGQPIVIEDISLINER